jgi:CRISPR/Cas system-associated exonuclease Cas4 (RecB family)
VTALDWPEPMCEPLTQASPSTLNALSACPKRLAFQRYPGTRGWIRRSTRAALGVASHALVEQAARGGAPAVGKADWLQRRWDQLIEHEFILMRASWPGREVPAPSAWPGYVATRTRLLRRLESEPLQAVLNPAGASSGALRPSLPWIERHLEDRASRLMGTPDRVESRAGQLRVVDLKSGTDQRHVEPKHRRQLLIYAHLVERSLGRMPDVAVIESVKGREEIVPVDPSEVTDVVAAAGEDIDGFNDMLQRGHVPANTDPEACGLCPFRVVCDDYWKARTPDWPRLDLRGTVATVDDLAITVTNGTTNNRILITPDVSLRRDDEIAVADLDRAGPGTGRMRWSSRLRQPTSSFA